MSKTNLELMSTEDLIAELAKRHDALLVVGLRRCSKHEDEVLTDYRGGLTECIGLACRAKSSMLKQSKRVE